MRVPFAKVYIQSSGRDISELIEKFRYEAAIEKDSLIQLTIKQKYAFETADDDDIVAGKILACQFGFLGEVMSPVRQAEITDIELTYADRISMVVKCLDRGHLMKKNKPAKVWGKLTASGIAKEMAKKYNLEADVDETSKKYDSLPQGSKNDFQFLGELAQKEGGYIFYIEDKTLHFKKIDKTKPAKFLFTYGENIISFSPKYKESQQKGAGKKTSVKGFDPMNKKPIDGQATPEEPKLAKFDINGGQVNNFGSGSSSASKSITPSTLPAGKTDFQSLLSAKDSQKEQTNGAGQYEGANYMHGDVTVFRPVQTKADADNQAKNEQKTAGKSTGTGGAKVLTATLKADGNPTITTTDIVTIAGVAKRYSGNWFVIKATHDISPGSAYVLDVELNRDGTGKPATKDGTKTNTSNTVNGSVGLRSWNANGEKKIPVKTV